ncbi:MAG: hypothetical protein WD990_00130, partial [Acidimicrobiia bacterium]
MSDDRRRSSRAHIGGDAVDRPPSFVEVDSERDDGPDATTESELADRIDMVRSDTARRGHRPDVVLAWKHLGDGRVVLLDE